MCVVVRFVTLVLLLAKCCAGSTWSAVKDEASGDTSDSFYATLLSPPQADGELLDAAQLSFSAEGGQYNLTLRRSSEFVDPNFLVLHRYDNFTDVVSSGRDRDRSCFFSGSVTLNGTARPGRAAVNLCGGLLGLLEVGDESLVIEPRRHHRRTARAAQSTLVIGPLTLRRVTTPLFPEFYRGCSTETEPANRRSLECKAGPSGSRRKRRDVRRHQLTIELAVFVDLPLQKQMKDLYGEHTDEEVSRFVMAMVNAMELLYDDSTLQRKVQFVLKRLELLETAPEELAQQRDINAFLTSFCRWQQRRNPEGDKDPLHWDHAVLLTGVDLFTAADSREVNRQVVGFAPVGGMCNGASSCTVNEGKDFESVYIVAHEIGHSLGMHHDGQGNECNEEDHIMSPTLGTGKNTWSRCSRVYLDRFAEQPQADCLRDSNLRSASDGRPDTLPGESIGADQQCRLKYGPSSARAREQPLAEVCVNLHCKYDHHRWTSHPALEGTSCGYDNWCRRGQCVARSSAAVLPSATADGGWSEWSAFEPCASSCLLGNDGVLTSGSVGIQERFRRCNSPYPRNGGTECRGGSRRYQTCDATALCARAGGRTVTEYAHKICRQAARDDRRLTGHGLSRLDITSSALDACNIWCERRDGGYERHRQSYPDGTRCATRHGSGSRLHHCIDGRCQPFSCEDSEDGESLFTAGADAECRQPATAAVENALRPLPEPERPRRSGWARWRSYSRCRYSCTTPAEGLELVQRRCQQPPCSGLEKTIRRCSPQHEGDECLKLRTPFEFATEVCQRYREKLSLTQLSGIGMQLPSSEEDPDRPCTVTCQDRDTSLRFYRVKGREGWFPSGLECGRGEVRRTAFCLSGKCVDFGDDGTPLHDTQYDYAYLFESGFRRRRLLRRDTSLASRTVDRAFIERVISDMERPDDEAPRRVLSADDIDLGHPLQLAELPAGLPGTLRPGLREPSPLPPQDNGLGMAFALGEPERQVDSDKPEEDNTEGRKEAMVGAWVENGASMNVLSVLTVAATLATLAV